MIFLDSMRQNPWFTVVIFQTDEYFQCIVRMGICFGTSTNAKPQDHTAKSWHIERAVHIWQNCPLTEKEIWNSSTNDARSSHGASIDTTDSPVMNHGLMQWEKQRREWNANRTESRIQQPREPVIRMSSTYESLLGTGRPFAKPIPLVEMTRFLIGIWEQEGLRA